MECVVAASDQLIDHFLPTFDFRERHGRRIEASPSRVRASLLSLTPGEMPLGGVMLALRLAPTIIATRRWPLGLGRPWIDSLLDLGFVELANQEDEIVVGAVGQFWRLREELVTISDADAFVRFDEPGYAKGAMNFRIIQERDTTRLTTETRVQATDGRARRSFRPYWVPVRAVGGLMRREMLRAVGRRVARASGSASIS